MIIDMYILQLLFILLFIASFSRIRKALSGIKKESLKGIIAICIIFAIVYIFFVPHIIRVLPDEAAILSLARGYGGGPSENMNLYAIYNEVYAVFGPRVANAIGINIFFGIANIFVLYIILRLLFGSELLSLAASTLVGMVPVYMAASTSSHMIIIPEFFLLLSTMLFILFLKTDSLMINALLLSSLSLTILSRIELVAILPIIFFWWIIFKRRYFRIKKRSYWIKQLSLWLLIMIPVLALDYLKEFFLKFKLWRSGVMFTFSISNLSYWEPILDGMRYYYLIPILLISLVFIILSIWCLKLRKYSKEYYFLLSIALSFLLLYKLNTYIAERHFIIMIPFFSVSFFVPFMPYFNNKKTAKRLKHILLALFIILLALSVIAANNERYSPEHRKYIRYIPRLISQNVPEECTVFMPFAYFGTMEGNIKAEWAFVLPKDPSIINRLPCSYFLRSPTCNIPRNQYPPVGDNVSCGFILENYNLKRIVETNRTQFSTSQIVLYQITGMKR